MLDSDLQSAPEIALAERFAVLAEQGILVAPRPRIAADHFIALTLLLASNGSGLAQTDWNDDANRETILEGVRAFIRAYTPR